MKVKIFTGYHSHNPQEPANIVMKKIDDWREANPECTIKDIEVVPYAMSAGSTLHIFVTATIKYSGDEASKNAGWDNE